MAKTTHLVFVDRDGTINKAEYVNKQGKINGIYLGHQQNWKNNIEFLPKVIRGLKLLNNYKAKIFIVTSQTGVALLGKYKQLNYERAKDVNRYIINILQSRGISISGFRMDCHISSSYAKTKKREGIPILKKYIRDNYINSKPNPGMLNDIKQRFLNTQNTYSLIGDRYIDILTAKKFSKLCKAVLVPSLKTDKSDVQLTLLLAKKYPNTYSIEHNFYKACRWIVDQQNYGKYK